MTEADLLIEITDLCEELGLLWHHCPDSRRCHGRRGFPDLIIVGRHDVLFRELKSDHGETSADQDLWLWSLRRAGADWAIWWPLDWHSGTIRLELEAIT